MNKKSWIAVLALIILLILWIVFVRAEPEQEPSTSPDYAAATGPTVIGDQLLVDFNDDVSDDEVERLALKYGLKLKLNSKHSLTERLYRATLKRLPARLLKKLRAEPLLEHAELDAIYSIPPLEAAVTRFDAPPAPEPNKKKTFRPNDPKYRYQWHLDQIGMPDAWPKATGKGVIVAVIDTGVSHQDYGKRFKGVPDLKQTEFVKGYDFVNNREVAVDDHGHGTHVAGTIAQSTNNKVGVAGVAFGAKIMPLKVLNAGGYGNVGDIADAIRFAADHGAKVINMSLGSNRSSRVMAAAVKYAHGKGVAVVCAAGNNGHGKVGFPAANPGAIAVAATQYDRTTTFYSNWGKEIDVAAPGGNTRVDQNNDGMPDGVMQNTIKINKPLENDYLLFMGTSMASPHVAGVAALIVGRGVTDPDAVLKLLKATARHPGGKKWDEHYGAGIVDASAALDKSTTSWGAYKLGLGGLLGLLLMLRLRSRGLLALKLGAGALGGLVLGSSGLFVLSTLGLTGGMPSALSDVLTNGAPAWDMALLGAGGHGNPLFYSALLPLGLTALLYGTRLRGLVFGFAVGVAAHLLFAIPFDTHDVTWIPNVMALDQLWLGLNGLACLGIAWLVAKKK
jgi:serine protease